MALWEAGFRALRPSPVDATPRGVFCAIGICQECAVIVEGVRRPACTTTVVPGLSVRSIRDHPTGPRS
jgi:hypothetical protein